MSDYHVRPTEARRGGLVLLGGLSGPEPYLTGLADEFASEGYEVVAPDVLADLDRDVPEGADQTNLDAFVRTGWGEACLPAVRRAIEELAPPVFVLGFSFGGTLAWLAAARLSGVSGVSSFYGGHVVRWLDEGLRCPVALHFGQHDPMIPPNDVQRIRETRPDLPVYVYDAGHNFVAPGGEHDADATRLAMLRTRQLFTRAGGGKGEMAG